MRIISGKWKGRKFHLPKGVTTRPTSDMLREALFSILHNDITKAVVFDMFAGSASFAFEALSQGASHAIICDSNKKCTTEIEKNLERFNADENEFTVINSDFKLAVTKTMMKNMGVDICFIDPPYSSDLYLPALKNIAQLMNADGIVILEHGRRDIMPESIECLVKTRSKKYGNTAISIYRKECE